MATGYSPQTILAPKQIVGVFSQVRPALRTLSTLFGFNIGGWNRTRYAGVGRHFSYDIFNSTRKVAQARIPGQASSEVSPQAVGEVVGTFPRQAEKIDLLDEKITNQRVIGGPATTLDQSGESYITRQEMYLAERFANLIEFQTAAMLRNAYYYQQSGDKLFHDFSSSSAAMQVDFKVPAANQSTLNVAGNGARITASWGTASTDIPTQLFNLNADMIQVHGYPLQHIVLKSQLWNKVVNNDYIVAQAGSAETPVSRIERAADGVNFTAELRALPWITWHIYDHGLNIGTSETYTQLIEDDHFFGFPDPDPTWVQYLEGGEMVTEGPGYNAPRSWQYGTYAYAYPRFDPSGWTLHSLHNGIPALYNPNVPLYGNAT